MHALNQALRSASILARSEKIRFVAVGAWNTLFGYFAFVLTYLLLHESAGIRIILVVAYVIAMLQSFATQKLLVFRTGGKVMPQLTRFCVTSSVIFTINVLTLPAAIEFTEWSPVLAQALFVVASTIATYYAHKNFSFK